MQEKDLISQDLAKINQKLHFTSRSICKAALFTMEWTQKYFIILICLPRAKTKEILVRQDSVALLW